MALKRLKTMFGHKASVARAVISRVINGKQLQNDDMASLVDHYYSIKEWLITLSRLNYQSDLSSSNVICQAIASLPQRMQEK